MDSVRQNTITYFDQVAAQLDQRAWNVGTAPWADWAWEVIRQEIGTKNNTPVIVDLGCGTGSGIENIRRFLPGARLIGVDFSPGMLQVARKKSWSADPNILLVTSFLEHLSLVPESVDFFLSIGTFHHIPDKPSLFSHLWKQLRKGGKILVFDVFEPGPRYRDETRILREKHPEACQVNDAAWQSFQWIYQQDTQHPVEYHTDPFDFADLLENASFHPCQVHVSLQPNYSVICGVKPG